MAKQIRKSLFLFLLAFLLFSAAITGAYRLVLPNETRSDVPADLPLLRAVPTFSSIDAGNSRFCSQIDYRLYGSIPIKSVTVNQSMPQKLYLGGMPFGVKFLTEGVMIVGFCDITTSAGTVNPAKAAGLRQGDVITSVNNRPVGGSADLSTTVENAAGNALSVTYTREGKSFQTSLNPAYSTEEGKYKSGIYVRDSGAGIGTVTYIDPNGFAFAGLGHGICDAETGKLIPMQRGSVIDVTISGVVKGLAGTPGEVKGYFNSGKTGTLLGNTECGVYGVLAQKPETAPSEPIPVGKREELKAGKAYLCCMLDDNSVKQYEIQISDINLSATGNKCFTVKVTDTALLDKTGGIIQGMSGSPIIQNGKLVGAVTHVLISDPATGYGIFVENMLNAAQMPMQKAA